MTSQPTPTTKDSRRTLILLRRDDEILLAMKKRGFGEGKWNGAGGKLEPGETVEQALIRETEEEICVTPTHYWQVAELDFVQDSTTNSPWHMYIYAYICDEWDGEIAESEEMAPQWFSLDEIPYDDMWADDKHWLPLVLAGDKVTGIFTFDSDDNLLTHSIMKQDLLPLESTK